MKKYKLNPKCWKPMTWEIFKKILENYPLLKIGSCVIIEDKRNPVFDKNNKKSKTRK